MTTDTAQIGITDLTVQYGPVTALDSVSMTIRSGATTAVLGANGAGKTTLLRTMSGLIRPTAGSITFAGDELVGVSPDRMSRRGIAHVPEGRGVIAELTVDENLRLGELGRNRDRDAVGLEQVYDMFAPLAGRRTSSAHTLSGGERQMLVIGRALMATPSVLLLDEPSLGLAPKIVAQIFDIIATLVETQSLTVVLVEQNARSALAIAEHAVVLDLGKVAVEGPADVLANDPALRHAYLGF